MPAAARKERHADAEVVRLRIEDAELRHPLRAEQSGCIAGRRNDVRVIHLGGEEGGDEAEDKKKNVPGSFHYETFPGTGTCSERAWAKPHSPGRFAAAFPAQSGGK